MPPEAQSLAYEERQAEIDDLAGGLRKVSRKAWKQPRSFALSMLGATWTLVAGNPIGAVLSGAGAVLKMASASNVDTGAYSYLFNARSKYS
jgi:hypothetical protein